MWKDNKQVKKRQKTTKQAKGQLGGKAAAGTATAIKDKKGDI